MSEDNSYEGLTLEKAVIDCVEHYKEFSSLFNSLDTALFNASTSPLAAAYYSMLDTLISNVEEIFGIGGFLDWFIYDNDCGSNGLSYEAEYIVENSIVSEKFVVNNVRDFVDMIHDLIDTSPVDIYVLNLEEENIDEFIQDISDKLSDEDEGFNISE